MILDALMNKPRKENVPGAHLDATNDERSVQKPVHRARILLIDDDITYCKVMGKYAERLGIALTCCTSADALGMIHDWKFDGAIIDFNLGAVTGYEVAAYLEMRENPVPSLIVSHSSRESLGELPASVLAFINKSAGPEQTLNGALAICRPIED